MQKKNQLQKPLKGNGKNGKLQKWEMSKMSLTIIPPTRVEHPIDWAEEASEEIEMCIPH